MFAVITRSLSLPLNESPSEKEGKCQTLANALDPFTFPQ